MSIGGGQACLPLTQVFHWVLGQRHGRLVVLGEAKVHEQVGCGHALSKVLFEQSSAVPLQAKQALNKKTKRGFYVVWCDGQHLAQDCLAGMQFRNGGVKEEASKLLEVRVWLGEFVVLHRALASAGWDKALAAVVAAQGGKSIQQALSLLRSSQRTDTQQLQAREKADEQAIEELQKTWGAVAIEKALTLHPALQRYGVRILPVGTFTLLELVLDHVEHRALKLSSWSCAQRGSNIGVSLDSVWERAHQNVQEPTRGAEEAKPEETAQSSPCQEAGVCLCTGPGLALKKLRNSLLRQMKRLFKGASRQELEDGWFCLRLFIDEEQDSTEILQPLPTEEHFLHVALMYWKPYRPTFHKLLRSERPLAETHYPGQWVYVEAGALAQRKGSSLESH